MEAEKEYWTEWLEQNTSASSAIDDDFGLSRIADHFGKRLAVEMYWEGAEREENGDVEGGIALYRKAFRMWPALDSVTDGGLPRGVREQAVAAGLSRGLLGVVSVSGARASRVMCARGLLGTSDVECVEAVKDEISSVQSHLENNPQNATHKSKVGIFLNNPPDFCLRAKAPHIIGKLLQFASDAWAEADWSGSDEDPGPLHAVSGGIKSLSVRVAEHWEYQIGSGLTDPLHYDTDSVLTIVALLCDSDDFEGGTFRTNEPDGQHLEHAMALGDAICFLSHKYHNITPLTKGVRKSLVIELWQGGVGHFGR